MKITATFYASDEGSDDPRAVQGGGGATERLVRTARNSPWLIIAYARAFYNRYDETLTVRIAR